MGLTKVVLSSFGYIAVHDCIFTHSGICAERVSCVGWKMQHLLSLPVSVFYLLKEEEERGGRGNMTT